MSGESGEARFIENEQVEFRFLGDGEPAQNFVGMGIDLDDGGCQAAERCDGLDNDGDGFTDEGFPQIGQPCSAGVGAWTVRTRSAPPSSASASLSTVAPTARYASSAKYAA